MEGAREACASLGAAREMPLQNSGRSGRRNLKACFCRRRMGDPQNRRAGPDRACPPSRACSRAGEPLEFVRYGRCRNLFPETRVVGRDAFAALPGAGGPEIPGQIINFRGAGSAPCGLGGVLNIHVFF